MSSVLAWRILGIALLVPFTASLSRRDVFEQASQDICAMAGARVVVAADTLYFMGGRYVFREGATDTRESRLYSIPMKKSFPVDGPLSSDNYSEIYAPKQWSARGAFFQDASETMLYSFGGYASGEQDPINDLNTFNISSGEWSNVTVRGGDFNYAERIASESAISTDTSESLGFVTGTWDKLPGMVRFNASDPASPQWKKEIDNSPPFTLAGGMEFIRLGPKGSLVNFGGYNQDHINPNIKPPAMEQINVYDIDSATWYNVTAVGDVPTKRAQFCTAVSSAPDDSSFQITMYGGFDRVGRHAYADIHVLSIPSFQWINVTDSSNLDAHLADEINVSGRRLHQCVAYKDRQMFVLGGELLIGNKVSNFEDCSDDFPAIRVLDLGDFKWKSSWVGNPEPYTVPDAVTKVIGGDGQGGATMKEPEGGFNDSALGTSLAQVVPRSPPSDEDSGGESGDGGNVVEGDGDDPSNINIGAIAGGAAGGVAALIIIAALVFFLRKRKWKANPMPENALDQKPAEEGQEAGELDQSRAELAHGQGVSELNARGWHGRHKPVGLEMDTGYRGNGMPVDEDRERRRARELAA